MMNLTLERSTRADVVATATSRSRRPTPLLKSNFMGGFECSTQRRMDGRRLDVLSSSGHAVTFREDYAALRRHGVATARDGLRWHLIETRPGHYDWSSLKPMLRAAREHGIQVIWDLCHYGWPDDIDIWSADFIERFSRFAAAAALVVADHTDGAPFFCPINEISFWAWAGGEVARFAPGTTGRGDTLKCQLVRASVAAIEAIRRVCPEARFIHAEPAIHVDPGSHGNPAEAEIYRSAQFEALDMMAGRTRPELGGHAECLDIVGVNFYPDNQWFMGGNTIPLGHHAYRPFRAILSEVYERYRRPLIVSETGAEGGGRPAWLHYVCQEVRAARKAGIPVEAICIYPILDYPGWDNERVCEVGLFSAPDFQGRRSVDPDFAEELARWQLRLSRERIEREGH